MPRRQRAELLAQQHFAFLVHGIRIQHALVHRLGRRDARRRPGEYRRLRGRRGDQPERLVERARERSFQIDLREPRRPVLGIHREGLAGVADVRCPFHVEDEGDAHIGLLPPVVARARRPRAFDFLTLGATPLDLSRQCRGPDGFAGPAVDRAARTPNSAAMRPIIWVRSPSTDRVSGPRRKH